MMFPKEGAEAHRDYVAWVHTACWGCGDLLAMILSRKRERERERERETQGQGNTYVQELNLGVYQTL